MLNTHEIQTTYTQTHILSESPAHVHHEPKERVWLPARLRRSDFDGRAVAHLARIDDAVLRRAVPGGRGWPVMKDPVCVAQRYTSKGPAASAAVSARRSTCATTAIGCSQRTRQSGASLALPAPGRYAAPKHRMSSPYQTTLPLSRRRKGFVKDRRP